MRLSQVGKLRRLTIDDITSKPNKIKSSHGITLASCGDLYIVSLKNGSMVKYKRRCDAEKLYERMVYINSGAD